MPLKNVTADSGHDHPMAAESRDHSRRLSRILIAAMLVLCGCRGESSERQDGTSPQTTLSQSSASVQGTTSTSVPIAQLAIRPSDLPARWQDLGEVASSQDLVDPPASCAAYAAVFATRVETSIHELTKDLAPSGDESGHINSTIVRVGTTADPIATVQAVTHPEFATCAVDTGYRRFQVRDDARRGAAASPMVLNLPVTAAGWRVTANLPGEPGTQYMDVVYLAHGRYIEKLRITRCSCARDADPLTAADLHPGETQALEAAAARLASV
jgi:hypothetical protein